MTTYSSIVAMCNRINDEAENGDQITHRVKLNSLKSLLKTLDQISDDALKARTLANYARELLFVGEVASAHDAALKALDLARNLEDKDLNLKAINTLGNVHNQAGRFALALDYYHQGLRLTEYKDQKVNYKSTLINNIATVYNSMGMKEKAINYYYEAFELARKEFNIKSQYLVAYNIVDLHLEQKQLNEVPTYLNKMAVCLKSVKYLEGLYFIVLSKYLSIQEQYKDAETELKKAELLFEAEEDLIGLNAVIFERVKQLYRTGRVEDAFVLCQKVVENSEKIDDHEILRNALKMCCYLTEKLELVDIGFENYRKLINYDEKLMQNLYEASIFQLTEKTEIELNEKIKENNEKLFENMRFIHEVSKDISKEQDYDTLIELIIQKLKSFVACDAIVIGLYDKEKALITRRTMYHDGEISSTYDISVSNKSSLAAWTIRNEKEVYTGRNTQLKLYDFESLNVNFLEITVPYETVFYVPLVNDNEVIGVFSLQKYEPNGFDYYELEMIRVFSSYISIAITNALKSEQMKILNRTLEHISRRDGLSGLLNRNALNEDVKKILNTVRADDLEIATILCDIDFFKEYNDQYGHLEGDHAIKSISDVIFKEASVFTPYVYRFGGDEFLVIIPNADYEKVKTLANKMLVGVNELNILHKDVGVNKRVSISIGVAIFEHYDVDTSEDLLLKNADIALYGSKRVGRNQVQIIKF
ncbi:sensor domain-containing diguanylate cyclase [Fusibacter ferrireducens]|uniref:Diguanylate cyclase n=1 Tax=Fusibacter ferrireducens TaxID=2785058 RepID=A0ABR9ZQL0_9FIRM|nr:diguanylate cyclase [Fusibacter ferrireducens]MBF4692752.1 diguanylate cyclase [Fusibacter ferrireducens]